MPDIRGFLANGSSSKAKTHSRSRRNVVESDSDDVETMSDKPQAVSLNNSPAPVAPETFFGSAKARKVPSRKAISRRAEETIVESSDQQRKDSCDHGNANEQYINPPSVDVNHASMKRKADISNDALPSAKRTQLKTTIAKKEGKLADAADQILSSVPLVDIPEAGDVAPFAFGQPPQSALAPGSKTIPEGAPDCLSGLSFVFTGVLQSLERQEAQDLVRKHGGRVLTAPSKNTSFVVIGEQAGPAKIKKIRDLNIKTIDEDGLLQLVASMPAAGGGSANAQKAIDKRQAEDQKAHENAVRMAKEEAARQRADEAKLKQKLSNGQNVRLFTAQDQLWTKRYAPSSIKDIIGNKGNVDKISKFLAEWPKHVKAAFKKPGPEGLGLYRAILISGAPGVGKTTSAHLAASLAGYDVIEFNASDTRSKKLLENGLAEVVDNASLNGYFSSESAKLDKSKKRLVLIMDEVDGMSAGDRGGVGALNTIIRKTLVPIICICNDRASQKLKPLDKTTFDIRFTKPTKDQIRSRIMSIAYKERLTISPSAIDQLVESTGSDIRQIINLLSTYRLTATSMDQSESRRDAQNAEKHVVLKPWDIVSKLLNGAIYNDRSKVSLNEKIELYFNDHELSYLMLQENYLGTTPDRCRTAASEQERRWLKLKLSADAAASISDGDLVDAMIHGQQQHWSLMPIHAVFSCVRPASQVAGASGRNSFTSVLGNMSKTGKATRQLREIRAHLRLRISADRFEIRTEYLPVLFLKLPASLATIGTDSITRMIATMDEYYLTRDDYDNLLDLGLGDNDRAMIESKIPTATKTAFTRAYNKAAHPTAFIASGGNIPTTKKTNNDLVPDIEDAVDLSDDDTEPVVKNDDDADIDLKKDKLIVAPKRKSKPVPKAKPARGAK